MADLVVICSEFEQAINDIVNVRFSDVDDESIKEFIGSCTSALIRSIKSSEMAGFLGRFGPYHKQVFNKLSDDNKRAVTFYNNIVINRHLTAHANGGNSTFIEVKKFYEEGHVVLDFFQKSLNKIS